MYTLRPYQTAAVDALDAWWTARGADAAPLIVAPTGSGKSIIIAEIVRRALPSRALVLVPSKELARQNREKLDAVLQGAASVGYFSASLGARDGDADVVVATIGTAYRSSTALGVVSLVVVDEAHLVQPRATGMYRRLIADLAARGPVRVVGLTATPFRGTGEWLTSGEDALFGGVAASIPIHDLLAAGYLVPLVPPRGIDTRIDTSGVELSATGDYALDQLEARVDQYLVAAASEATALAAGRKKWLSFLPGVKTAHQFCTLLKARGVPSAVVCGSTPAQERDESVAAFRAGGIRCLVTVLALATGFDVPDVDCLVWLRPTTSPVLYVQGAGRGMRPAPGKTDCLWLDFTDTTERMGPVDRVRGRHIVRPGAIAGPPPYRICQGCGERCPPRLSACPTCGLQAARGASMEPRAASSAAVLSGVTTYSVTRVGYELHTKLWRPPSLRVEYYSGRRRVAREWVCIEHQGYAASAARKWWLLRGASPAPTTAEEALRRCGELATPIAVRVDETGRFPRVVECFF